VNKINIPLVRIFPIKSFPKRQTWKLKLIFRKMKYSGRRKLGLNGATEQKFNELPFQMRGGGPTTRINI
jgi:hypothetical protein